MGIRNWISRLISPQPDDEAAEREEFGAGDAAEAELHHTDELGSRSARDVGEAAEQDLESFEPPRDPTP